jgi:16S rRNA (cytosine967-C5)-methyltransferase
MGVGRSTAPRRSTRLSVPSPARALALTTLRRVSTRTVTLADALAAPDAESLDPRERALLHELVLGTLRRRGWLDHALERLSSRPLERLSPGVLDALRLGTYQLLFLRVPVHAAVSESVELARSVEPRSAGFANAVLRRLQREGPPPEPDPDADPLGWLSTAGSLPRWLAERWLARLGPEAAVARARAALEPPPTHFRLNPRFPDVAADLAAAGIESRPTAVPGALEAGSGRLTSFAERGALYVQDAGSQLVARLAATDGLVLDACAAPGGKALLLADLGGPGTRVIAAEGSRRRLGSLVRSIVRWGAPNLWSVAADALHPPFAPLFDGVLLDAPCSGLGTLARHPDIRWRLAPADLPRHAARQKALLHALAPLVRPGGRLVYATCSVEPEETEAVVVPFLEARPDFSVEPLPAWAGPFFQGRFAGTGPPRHRGDAFFAARLRRAG